MKLNEFFAEWKWINEIINCQVEYISASGWKLLREQVHDTEHEEDWTSDIVDESSSEWMWQYG